MFWHEHICTTALVLLDDDYPRALEFNPRPAHSLTSCTTGGLH